MMQEPEYEPAPRPAPVWATPAVIAVLTLLAVYVVINYRPDAPEPLVQAPSRSEAPPNALVDGSALPEVPQALANRFAEPVLLTRRLEEAPESVTTTCNSVPFGNPDEDYAARRLLNLLQQAEPIDIRLGPDALTYLLVGSASSPPSYPDQYQASCLARHEDGQWSDPARRLGFADDGESLAGVPDAGLESRLVRVPPQAAWVVQERPGWWLAHDVAGTPWLQAPVRTADAEDSTRTVFLDGQGTVLADRPLTEAPNAHEEISANQPSVVAGDNQEVLSLLRERGPRYFCSDDVAACVWLSLVDNEIVAVSAFGPHHLDVPPFGYVGYCPATNAYEGSTTTARFDLDGSWLGGPARRDLATYGVRVSGENLVVDLGSRQLGDVRGDEEGVGDENSCVFDGKPVGTAPDAGEAADGEG